MSEKEMKLFSNDEKFGDGNLILNGNKREVLYEEDD